MKRTYSDDDSSQEPERKRSAQACLPCRKKKMRCDGKKPKCSHCDKLDLECGYNQNRKPGLQPGYVAQLQSRIGELEVLLESRTLELQRATSNFRPGPSLFDDRRPRSFNDPPYYSGEPALRAPLGCVPYRIDTNVAKCERPPSQGHTASGEESSSRHYRQDASGLDHLAHAAMSSPPVVAANDQRTTPEIDPTISGSTAMSFPTFPHNIFNSGAETYTTPTLPQIAGPVSQAPLHSNDPHVSPKVAPDGLPSKELLDIMVDIYFQYGHPALPILHKDTFLTALQDSQNSPPEMDYLIHALVVSASSYANLDPRLSSSENKSLCKLYSSDTAYHQKLIDFALDRPCLESLQSLAILAHSYIASGNTSRLRAVIAVLTYLSNSLSLQSIDVNNENRHFPSRATLPSTTNHHKMEEYRRCFWVIYVLDRFICTSTNTSHCISEKEICVKLPRWDIRPAPAAHLWELCIEGTQLLGRTCSWIRVDSDPNMKVWKRPEEKGYSLLEELRQWWSGLDDATISLDKLEPEHASNKLLLHATHSCIMILISGAIAWEDREVDAADNERSMGSVEPSTWPYLAVPSVVARGNQGVNEMATLARIFNAKPDLIAYSSPLIPLCLFLALRFLIVTRNFPGGRQSLKDVSPLRRALSALRTIFPVAGQYLESIEKMEENEHNRKAMFEALHRPAMADTWFR